MFLDTSKKLPKGLFKACVTPKPIAWISSKDIDGNHNLSPFSYFNIVCEDPPMVMFATTGAHHNGGAKDTLKNVEETKEFTVNLVSHNSREAMNITAIGFSRGINEFDMADVAYMPGELIQTHRVKESPISLECVYHQSIQLPTSADATLFNRMILGKVVGIHLKPNILTKNNRINPSKLNILAHLGYNNYTKINTHFELNSPCECCDKVMD